MSETKKNLYEKIGNQKEYFNAYFKKDRNLLLKFPKKAFDRICKFYGRERLTANSFIIYHTEQSKTLITRAATTNYELGEGDAKRIFGSVDVFHIIPKSLESLDEEERFEKAIKLDGKHFKNIIKKAGIDSEALTDLVGVQIVSLEEHETTKTHVSYHVYEKIFSLIPLLLVQFENGQNFEITFYSFRTILNKCGISLEDILTYINTQVKDIDREELMKKITPLIKSCRVRQLKSQINDKIKDDTLYGFKGCSSANQFKKIPFDDFEHDRNEESDKMNELIEKVNKKKIEVKQIYDNVDNQIVEVKDKNNKVVFIRKKIIDVILSSPESQFDEYKTTDIDGNEVLLSRKLLKENKYPTLVKMYNKDNKDEYIFIIIKEIDDSFNKFTYFRQEEAFKGKNKNNDPKEIKCLMMDLECESLPKLEEGKKLFSMPEKEAANDKVKSDLLDKLDNKKKENKDILICKKKNKFVRLTTLMKIKEKFKNIKNKNIKLKVNSVVNKEEPVELEYSDIFEDDDDDFNAEFVILKDIDRPDDQIIANKDEFQKELDSWDDPSKNIKLKNNINNKEVEINPSKIGVVTPEKEEIPQNFENAQEEIKKQLVPEDLLIKTNNCLIHKSIAQKIINDPEAYDEYYIKDINNKKVKVSKKQLIKDNDDASCQYISILNEEDPGENIFVSQQELTTKLEEDPTQESMTINDFNGKPRTIKKTKVKCVKIKVEDVNLDDQPQKVKNELLKDVKDYFYLYTDKDNKPHYIRIDYLKAIKNYNSAYPIENFEVEDEKENKVLIPKEIAVKLLDNENETKYICLDDEETKGEPVMAELQAIEKSENDLDEPIQVNKDGKKIRIKKVKVRKLKAINSLSEQPEEKIMESITLLIKDVQKQEPLSDIIQVKDSNDKDIFIFEETLNKIEENKSDPEKTTYKGSNPMKEEFICPKNPKKLNANKYLKLTQPNIIVDKNDLEKALKEYKPSKKMINIKDIKGNSSEVDPLSIHIYKASPEETDITKILPKDFSDINDKLLIDIVPQNKLILTKDQNNADVLIKHKTGSNMTKLPKTDYDSYTLFDKDGKKIKVSRKKIEKDSQDNNCEFIELKDDENKSEIVYVADLTEALKDKENEEFEIKNKDGKKIKLNKKKIQIVKQNNQYIEIPEQGADIKKKLLSEVKDCFIKIKDSKNNKDTYLRNSQLTEIINYKPKAPFVNYELLNPKKEQVFITKEICQQKISEPENNKFILCYDEAHKDKTFLVSLDKIKNSNCEGDDQFDVGNGQKVIFKNLRIKKLEEAPKLGEQPEEEKMVKVLTLLNKVKTGPVNKNYKTKNAEGKDCFINNNYLNKLKNASKGDDNDTKYVINDAFGKSKVTLIKTVVDKDNKPGEYILIKNKSDNKTHIVEYKDLINSLTQFKSVDDEIKVMDAFQNKKINLNPLNIEIVPPFNDFPLDKKANKKDVPKKAEEEIKIEEKSINSENIENKDHGNTRLRSMPRQNLPEKKTYRIRRAIIYKKHRKDEA